MRQRYSCISHGSNVDHNALRSGYATMRNAQCNDSETTFFELDVYITNRLTSYFSATPA